ncbi:MAG: response regulator [Clostridia bacterium]|nr:response regulator [Clostridia bacterium]
MNILIVDNDYNSCDIMANFFKELGHYAHGLYNSQEVIKNILENNYDLVLTNISMPSFSGIDILKLITSLPNKSYIKCVLFTAYPTIETAVEALRQGAYDYLTKPINVTDLARILDRIEDEQKIHEKEKQAIKILTLDHNLLFIEGIKCICRNDNDITLMGNTLNIKELVLNIANKKPDIVIVDESFGFDVINLIKNLNPQIKIIVFLSYCDNDAINMCFERGADAYFLRNISPQDFVNSLKTLVAKNGNSFKELNHKLKMPDDCIYYHQLKLLSRQERKVLKRILEGKTNKEIAKELFVCASTIRNHVTKILRKFNLPNRTAVAAYVSKLKNIRIED